MVQGLDKLQRRLVDEIPANTRAALEKSMIESADKIVSAAQLRVPVDKGNLRGSIRRTDVKEGKRGGLYIAVTAGEKTLKGYNTARIVEFGTVDTPAQPFLLPAYRLNSSAARRRMRKAIRDGIEKK